MMLPSLRKHPAVWRRRGFGADRGVALLLVALALGCGQNASTDLSGKVTIGGEPIPADAEATIGFIPPGGSLSEAITAPINAGAYQITGVPVGLNKVVFHIERPVGPVRVSERTGQEYQEKRSLVPPAMAGGVEVDISAGGGEQDFDL